mmetsp:Transcript_4483/g.7889  ORF Transcript_4483/g.7889 Transcript_4483/m.7889 type:complete len:641 (+) Transcript_4483:111-2033(+)
MGKKSTKKLIQRVKKTDAIAVGTGNAKAPTKRVPKSGGKKSSTGKDQPKDGAMKFETRIARQQAALKRKRNGEKPLDKDASVKPKKVAFDGDAGTAKKAKVNVAAAHKISKDMTIDDFLAGGFEGANSDSDLSSLSDNDDSDSEMEAEKPEGEGQSESESESENEEDEDKEEGDDKSEADDDDDDDDDEKAVKQRGQPGHKSGEGEPPRGEHIQRAGKGREQNRAQHEEEEEAVTQADPNVPSYGGAEKLALPRSKLVQPTQELDLARTFLEHESDCESSSNDEKVEEDGDSSVQLASPPTPKQPTIISISPTQDSCSVTQTDTVGSREEEAIPATLYSDPGDEESESEEVGPGVKQEAECEGRTIAARDQKQENKVVAATDKGKESEEDDEIELFTDDDDGASTALKAVVKSAQRHDEGPETHRKAVVLSKKTNEDTQLPCTPEMCISPPLNSSQAESDTELSDFEVLSSSPPPHPLVKTKEENLRRSSGMVAPSTNSSAAPVTEIPSWLEALDQETALAGQMSPPAPKKVKGEHSRSATKPRKIASKLTRNASLPVSLRFVPQTLSQESAEKDTKGPVVRVKGQKVAKRSKGHKFASVLTPSSPGPVARARSPSSAKKRAKGQQTLDSYYFCQPSPDI